MATAANVRISTPGLHTTGQAEAPGPRAPPDPVDPAAGATTEAAGLVTAGAAGVGSALVSVVMASSWSPSTSLDTSSDTSWAITGAGGAAATGSGTSAVTAAAATSGVAARGVSVAVGAVNVSSLELLSSSDQSDMVASGRNPDLGQGTAAAMEACVRRRTRAVRTRRVRQGLQREPRQPLGHHTHAMQTSTRGNANRTHQGGRGTGIGRRLAS